MPAPRSGLLYREDYFDDPAGWVAVKQLLRDIFDVDIDPIDLYGGHDRTSMACAWFDTDGQVVANLSAFAMPLMIDGRRVRAAGWQSGAVRPGHRGTGLYRELMRRMLERCEETGHEAIVLLTDKPSLYQPLGFRVLRQHLFRSRVPEAGKSQRVRSLDLKSEADVRTIGEALARRTPVSRRFSVIDQSRLFLLNGHLVENVRLSLLEECGAVVAWRQVDGSLVELLDIAGPTIPSLADIGASLGLSGQTVKLGFPPDRLGVETETQPETSDLVFMMRSDPAFMPSTAFRLSPMAEF